jgi:hypothetical protein
LTNVDICKGFQMLTFVKGWDNFYSPWRRIERQKSIVIRLKVSQFISGIANYKINFVSLSVHKSALKNEHLNNLLNLELINSNELKADRC